MSAAPRFSRVARLVLRSALTCLVPLMSACVLPIAPEFQDPPTSQNYAPYFQTVMPDLGSEITVPMFEVTVTDPNVGDDLYVRWIVDYPPYNDNTRPFAQPKVVHSVDGSPLLQNLTFAPNCVDDNLAKIARHQIMVVVADRDFSKQLPMQAVDLTRLVPGDGRKVIGTWVLDMECK
jgi:hypothetical protein